MDIWKLEYFQTINFQIERYDKYSTIYFEDENNSSDSIKNLHRGYFTFEDDENNKYAFYEINKLTRQKNVNEDLYVPIRYIAVKSSWFAPNIL